MLVLTDPVGPVDGLGLGGRVPPGVEDVDVVGLGQRQPHAAGLEADQEHRSGTPAEGVDHRLAVPGAPVEVDRGDPLGRESVADPAEERGERAEDQRLVALGRHLGQLVDEQVDLGRADPVVLGVDQGGVESELAQLGERTEDGYPVVVEVVDQAEDPLALLGQVGVVDLAVARPEVDRDDLLLLGRQVCGDELLGATEHERPDPAAEPVEGGLVALLLDRPRDHVAKTPGRGVEAGSSDGQQGPQLHQPVLEGRPGDGEAEVGIEDADGGVGLALVVLDLLGLVEHDTAPVARRELVALEPEEGVGRHQHVVVARQRCHVVGAAGHDPDAQTGGVGDRLLAPRGHDTGGGDDQEAVLGPAGDGVLDEGEDLEGLAQTHVVGQNAAETVLVQEGEPPEALQLVGTQGGGHADRIRLGDLGEVTERGGPLDPRRRLGIDHSELGELGPDAEVGRTDTDPAVVGVAQLCGQRHDLVQPGELGAVEGDEEAARQDQELVLAGDGGQHVGEWHVLAVDAHPNLEVEPVGVVGLVGGEGELDLGGAGRLPEVGG